MLRAVGLRSSRRATTLAIDQFTYLPVTRDTALVRLRGQWHAPSGRTMPTPVLVIGAGRGEHRVAPLDRGLAFPPGGGEVPSPWRTTYLVPLDAFTQQDGFAVHLPHVAAWPLPLPTPERRPDEFASESAQVEMDVLGTRLSELEAALAWRADTLGELHTPLDVARGAAHVIGFKLAAQEERLAQLDSELASSNAAAQHRHDELSAALGKARERAVAAEAQAALAGGEVLELRDRLSELEGREAGLVLRLSSTHIRAVEAERARAALEAQVAELGAQIEALEREVAEHVRHTLDPRTNGDGKRAREALERRAVRLEEHVAELTRQSAELVGAA
jgi:hypothetical protein